MSSHVCGPLLEIPAIRKRTAPLNLAPLAFQMVQLVAKDGLPARIRSSPTATPPAVVGIEGAAPGLWRAA